MTDEFGAPPNDVEAEQAAIGAMIIDREMIPLVLEHASPADFYTHVHETIAEIIARLFEDDKPVDKIAIAEALRSNGTLEKCGGLPYLTSLLEIVPTASSAEYYATLVAEKAQLRRLMAAGLEIQRIALAGEPDVDEAVSDSDAALQKAISASRRARGGISMSSAMRDAFNVLSDAVEGTSAIKAIQTPWARVNTLIGGFFPEELCVIASAPAMGKTGLVIDLADFIAQCYGSVAFFSLEMSPRAIAQRWLALHSDVSARNQRLGRIRSAADWEAISDAMSVISSRGVTLFGREASSIESIRREVSRMHRESPVRAIIIDHVNFLADVDSERGDRTTKHERLDRSYKRLLGIAQEFQTVIFAVQHMNRAGMTGRPTLANIRDGGNPEGHAHAIMFPYRPHPASELAEERMEGELIIAKSRDGEEGIVPMEFRGWRHMWLQPGESPWFKAPEAA